jgi:hypothetical protein
MTIKNKDKKKGGGKSEITQIIFAVYISGSKKQRKKYGV